MQRNGKQFGKNDYRAQYQTALEQGCGGHLPRTLEGRVTNDVVMGAQQQKANEAQYGRNKHQRKQKFARQLPMTEITD